MTRRAKYVLDTNVVTALRISGRHPEVENWVSAVPIADQYITALTLAQIERGVFSLERSDAAQGGVLRRWLEDRVLPAFHDRVLPFDAAAARILASYRVPEHAPFDDALIAATAEAANMKIVTRNTRHFAQLGIETIDPWRS